MNQETFIVQVQLPASFERSAAGVLAKTMEATHVNVGSVTSAEGNDAKEQPKKKKLLQHQSMLIGTSEESVGKVSCNFFVFLKQFIYHLLPPFVNCLLCRVLEGSQGATNQAMWSPSSSAISAFFWYFTI